MRQRRLGAFREEGSSLVEMALTCSILLSILVGIIESCFALYTYNFVSEAAREATRYAVIRGSTSCGPNPNFPNCNLNPATAGNPIQTYLQGLGFPNSHGLTATVTWWSPVQDASGSTTWPTACTTATDANGNACNLPGNAVKVNVTYTFPLVILGWQATSLNVSSTSEMMISE
ncbi:MAG: TadE/TadG family type IV pilus assembly protein [Terracidiphilus sp.]